MKVNLRFFFTFSPPEGPEDEECAAVLGGVYERQQLSFLLPLGQFKQDAEETLHAQGEGQAARPIRERYHLCSTFLTQTLESEFLKCPIKHRYAASVVQTVLSQQTQ